MDKIIMVDDLMEQMDDFKNQKDAYLNSISTFINYLILSSPWKNKATVPGPV